MAKTRVLALKNPHLHGDDVASFQRALARRCRRRYVDAPDADGDYGALTDRAAQRVAYLLGAQPVAGSESAARRREGMIRHPGLRTPAELGRATTRMAAARKEAKAAKEGPQAALAEARRWIGKTESPSGSNLAPWGLTQWIDHFLGVHFGVPWCGIFVGHCLEAAGVNVTSRVASVNFIYLDAIAGRNGFESLVPEGAGKPGDAIGLFSTSTHVELIVRRVKGGYVTYGGNTSPGNQGSQANGGGAFMRLRSDADVAYVARPAY